MIDLKIKIVDASYNVMAMLEDMKLINRFFPSKEMYNSIDDNDRIETEYISDPCYGSHKLICIRKNTTELNLTAHPDNEEILLINPSEFKFKPLYFIIGLEKHLLLEEKIRTNTISPDNILAIKMKYNDPETSFFTVLRGTPHWEATCVGEGLAPVFFVTEPSDLKMDYIALEPYNLILEE